MKKCVLFILSLFVVVPVSGQESGNRIYGNSGYYQQKRQMLANTGMLGGSNEGYAIEARVLTNLKPDAFVVVFGVNDEGANAAASNDKVNSKVNNLIQKIRPLGIESSSVSSISLLRTAFTTSACPARRRRRISADSRPRKLLPFVISIGNCSNGS